MVRMRASGEQAESVAISDAMGVGQTLAGDREAYRMTGNREDAEEVVQEAFLRAYQKLAQFAGNANFGTWVYRIAANYAIDRLRQRKSEDSRREQPSWIAEGEPETDLLSQMKDAGPSPERLAGSAQLAAKMKQALE